MHELREAVSQSRCHAHILQHDGLMVTIGITITITITISTNIPATVDGGNLAPPRVPKVLGITVVQGP